MDLIQPVSMLSWPVLEDLLSDSDGIFQIACQSITYPSPFFRKVEENKKKDHFYTKTRLTRYLRNLIFQNCTNKSQKWLYEKIWFLKIFKILAFFPCQRYLKRTRFKAFWPEFSKHQFSSPRPPCGQPQERKNILVGEARQKKTHFFPFFTFKSKKTKKGPVSHKNMLTMYLCNPFSRRHTRRHAATQRGAGLMKDRPEPRGKRGGQRGWARRHAATFPPRLWSPFP